MYFVLFTSTHELFVDVNYYLFTCYFDCYDFFILSLVNVVEVFYDLFYTYLTGECNGECSCY